LLCAAGGALLMTHSHPLKNLKDSMLVELSHTPIALLGATAGWSRWLELRLPDKRDSKIASYIWPVCLILVGVVLLDYREA
jgi:copper resistance protein D